MGAAPGSRRYAEPAGWNACFAGDGVAGVFDWDLAGPATPLHELAFLAWTGVPLWHDLDPAGAAQRLMAIADAYGGIGARQILRAVPGRLRAMFDGLPAAGTPGTWAWRASRRPAGGSGRPRPWRTAARLPAIDRLLPE